MRHVIIPKDAGNDIPFYLSVEEWVARNLPDDEYFFAWQVPPSIICGRHQDIPAEVDIPAAIEAGVQIWRRKSGGGAVLADYNNVMFSYITPSAGVEMSFRQYTDMICRMLASMNITAHATGRNDIAIGEKKVAGNAFLRLPGRSILHGTMLYDSDFELMGRLLTPARAKKLSKGVLSVPSRVTTLRAEGIAVDIDTFIRNAVNFLCPDESSAYCLTDNDLEQVKEIRESYINPVGKGLKCAPKQCEDTTTVHEAYINGVGMIKASYTVGDSTVIEGFSLSGDFFPISDVSSISELLEGAPLDRTALECRLKDVDKVIVGLDSSTLTSLILENY